MRQMRSRKSDWRFALTYDVLMFLSHPPLPSFSIHIWNLTMNRDESTNDKKKKTNHNVSLWEKIYDFDFNLIWPFIIDHFNAQQQSRTRTVAHCSKSIHFESKTFSIDFCPIFKVTFRSRLTFSHWQIHWLARQMFVAFVKRWTKVKDVSIAWLSDDRVCANELKECFLREINDVRNTRTHTFKTLANNMKTMLIRTNPKPRIYHLVAFDGFFFGSIANAFFILFSQRFFFSLYLVSVVVLVLLFQPIEQWDYENVCAMACLYICTTIQVHCVATAQSLINVMRWNALKWQQLNRR